MVQEFMNRFNGQRRGGRAAIAATVCAAGLCFGALAAVVIGQEVVVATCCSYQVTGLTSADVTALQSQGITVALNPLANNTGTIYVGTTSSSCASSATEQQLLNKLPQPVVVNIWRRR